MAFNRSQALFDGIIAQRNEALNIAADTAARLAEAEATIAELREQLKKRAARVRPEPAAEK